MSIVVIGKGGGNISHVEMDEIHRKLLVYEKNTIGNKLMEEISKETGISVERLELYQTVFWYALERGWRPPTQI